MTYQLNKTTSVDEEEIRSYVLRNDKEALSQAQLDCITYDYMNKVMRRVLRYEKWPKDIKVMMESKGIIQNKETGLPEQHDHAEKAWAMRALEADTEIAAYKNELDATHKLLSAAHQLIGETEGVTWDEVIEIANPTKLVEVKDDRKETNS